MTSNSDYLGRLLQRLSTFREEVSLTPAQVEERLILGPGWISAIEAGSIQPSLDVIASMLSIYGKSLSDLAEGATGSVPHINRSISAEATENDLDIHFVYAAHDAVYRLPNATLDQFTAVVLTLRNGLAQLSSQNVSDEQEKAIKTESVASVFLKAVELWPNANPSDLWWFVVYRAYCDQYNHPSEHSRLDFTQSWKRTGGWALERILERHYGPALAAHQINLVIADGERKFRLLEGIKVGHRLEADKMDVLLTVGDGANEKLIGVVHVKSSFAERRTDDVPMSHALVEAGYISPLWTMDCKSTPSVHPVNRGELGEVFDGQGKDSRSAKRKDIEDDGFFSACFSYNKNTRPTPEGYQSRARVYVCDFSDPNDAFTDFILSERERVRIRLGV
ncbi:BsaWI family type II restriction enzyme [Nodosilinea sp. PGN35]|uniref:BsaWI family type II restriction enzyme n=1 Tax=Nodosilinea sp. PGN35 TaxID=3020489 RepID=UPI0023B337C9|nr:BsaWI family type II restriction enzyme [Nodosilinea sp. TSF1-S3]MDF0369551.1 BsaWI family type II restriction enzyme [Nodosilinea sp. TSF1-S3]